MTTPSAHHLDVPGARLHYEVRGSGPLLLVVGQPMTGTSFSRLADLLADRYTVVTYDPRGLGRSVVHDASLDVTPELEADDLASLVDAVGGGPADVFGSSGGAVAGLAMAVRHPDKIRTLIAHEPPVAELARDARYVRAAVDDIEEAFRSAGAGAAWGKFVSLVIHDGPVTADGVPPAAWPPADQADAGGNDHVEGDQADQGEQDVPGSDAEQVAPVSAEKQRADDELFFLRMLKPFTRYQPAVESLRSGRPRVVVAVGAASPDEVAARSARALAAQLGLPVTTFPGDHGGFLADPDGFAVAIRSILSDGQARNPVGSAAAVAG